MTPDELRNILSQPEGVKLDFKREYKLSNQPSGNSDRQRWVQLVQGQWDELIKDILALTNGNTGTAEQTAFLIIGVDDQLQANGTRQLYDAVTIQLSSNQILDKVNGACRPPIANIEVERVTLDGNSILVISIPPSPHVHQTKRRIEPKTGRFDGQGTLVEIRAGAPFSEHVTFIRHGENIHPASPEERAVLEQEKFGKLPQYKQARLLDIISAVEKIRECTRESLIENQTVLKPFLHGRAERNEVGYELHQLFDGQRNRSQYKEWLAFLRAGLARETNEEVKAIIQELIPIVVEVTDTFYAYYKDVSEVKLKEAYLQKYLMAHAFSNQVLEDGEVRTIARDYLDRLRNHTDAIGTSLGQLKALI